MAELEFLQICNQHFTSERRLIYGNVRATPHGRRERKPVQRIAPRGGRGFFKVEGEDNEEGEN